MTAAQVLKKCPPWLAQRVRKLAAESGAPITVVIVFLLRRGVYTRSEENLTAASIRDFYLSKGVNTLTKGGAK